MAFQWCCNAPKAGHRSGGGGLAWRTEGLAQVNAHRFPMGQGSRLALVRGFADCMGTGVSQGCLFLPHAAIDIAFVDEAGLVVEAHCAVAPGKRMRNRKAVCVLERFSRCSGPWFEQGDRVALAMERNGR